MMTSGLENKVEVCPFEKTCMIDFSEENQDYKRICTGETEGYKNCFQYKYQLKNKIKC